MKKTFRSKVEPLVLIPVALVLAALTIFMIVKGFWIGVVVSILVMLFLAYLYFDTVYEFKGDSTLKIKSGFLYEKEIYIKSIKHIRPTRSHDASPALSGDRIEIQFNRYERVMISPDEQKEFIHRLKEINPRINVS